MAVAALPDTLIDELVAICGEEHVFTGRSALYNRARVPSPFPSPWKESVPCPSATEAERSSCSSRW